MPVTRTYVGSDEVYLVAQSRLVKPGDDVEFDEDPKSPLWVTHQAAKKAAEKSEED